MSAKVLILNLILLAVVLQSDLGRRKITLLRVARPIVTAAAIAPFFFAGTAIRGWGLTLEVAAGAVGLALGLLAAALLPVKYDPVTRVAYSQGGLGYLMLWVAVTAGRLFFAYGSTHIFGRQLGGFMAEHRIGAGALADSFIFLSLAMYLTRTIILLARWISRRRQGTAAAGRAASVIHAP